MRQVTTQASALPPNWAWTLAFWWSVTPPSLGSRPRALGEVAHQEILVERREVEAAAGFVHELHAVRVRVVVDLLVDPLDGLLDRGFADGHDASSRGSPLAPSPGGGEGSGRRRFTCRSRARAGSSTPC